MNQTKQATILVVDDDEASCKLLEALLVAEGYAVRTAASGEEALETVVVQPPDLILLDVMMPGIDGFEVTRRLKADSRSRPIPIIMVTSLEDRESHLKGLEAGADEFLSKPVDRAELRVRVRNLLKISEHNAALQSSEEKFRNITESAQDAIIMMGADQRILFWNAAAERILDYTAAEAMGQELHTLIAPTAACARFSQAFPHFQETGEGPIIGKVRELTALRKGGEEFPVELSVSAMQLNGQWHAIGIVRDITERKQTETELRIAATAFESQDGIMVTDAHNVILRVNRAFTEITGYTAEEAVGQTPRLLSSGRHDSAFYAAMWKSLQSTGAWQGEIWNRHKNGDVFPERLTITAVKGDAGEVTHYVAMMHDITERKQREMESQKLLAIVESTDDAIISKTLDGIIQSWNHGAEQIFGYKSAEVIGKPMLILIPPDKLDEEPEILSRISRGEKVDHFETVRQRKDGRLINISATISPIFDSHGRVVGISKIARDITVRKQAEEQIRALAFYDTLTQLPNRRLLNDRLEQTMAASKRSGRYGALMFMDLDNFKPLNDTHGHGVGDLLLIEVARRITGCVREMDTCARFGGDEFVVILGELVTDKTESAAQARIVAEKIRATLAEPYLLKIQPEAKAGATVEHHCTSSICIVLFINHEASAEDILKWADMAMYQAKTGGRNLIRFFDQDMAET